MPPPAQKRWFEPGKNLLEAEEAGCVPQAVMAAVSSSAVTKEKIRFVLFVFMVKLLFFTGGKDCRRLAKVVLKQ